jgi:hypothetical protein
MASPTIAVSNLRDHEVVPHALVVFDGHISDFHAIGLPPQDWFLDARLDAVRGAFWPVNGSGHFKALVLLPAPGKYTVTLRLGAHATRDFPIEYVPPVSQYIVRFYYQKCVDAAPHDGFDAPPGTDNSDQTAMQKIRFNALLLQAATAEMFVHAGLPRKTFSMEFAADGLPHVHLLRSSFPNATARTIHDQELIALVEKDIIAYGFDTHDELEFKHAVILGCSKYNPVTQHSDGHTALGGGKVGIFGSCGLHTWPRHLGEVSACCLNNQRIDTCVLMDDSGNRGTFWGNFSTGIGAFIHELGHTFGLGHATSGIMSRGFDDMTRLFCAYEPDCRRHEPGVWQDFQDGRLLLNHQVLREVASPNGAHWNIGSALQLVHCEWISARRKASPCGPIVCWNRSVRGPVGQNNTQGTKRNFGSPAPRAPLAAVLIAASQYLDDIKSYTQDEFARIDNDELCRFPHQFVLGPGEYITSVEVRAMAWIDGLCIHTNLRSSPWYGGQGGQLHVLRPDESSKINGFFGARGDDFVGSLGVFCAPTTAFDLSSSGNFQVVDFSVEAVRAGPIGYADQDGEQHAFEQLLPEDLGAVCVKAGDYVTSVRAYTRREWCAMGEPVSDPAVGENWFVLDYGEYITHADVRAMCWLDGIRFHTNTRESPWFGGSGGELQCLEPPAGSKIHGFFGSHGDNFVGALGAYCVPIPLASNSAPAPQATVVESAEIVPFSFLSDSPPPLAPAHPGVARGLVVAVHEGAVAFVRSFDSPNEKYRLVDELQAFVSVGAQLHCVSLHPHEFFTQIDASVHAHHRTIEGLCVHTNQRSSSWFGGYTDSQLHFLEPPSGMVIKSIQGVAGVAQLQDITGEYCPRTAALQEAFHNMGYTQLPVQGNLLEDPGAYDIRVEASSSEFGVESVYLLKKLEHEELEQHAWVWKSRPSASHPRVWCLPQRMLEHHLAAAAAQAGQTPTQLLFSGYAIGAMDVGGGYSMAASPPQ